MMPQRLASAAILAATGTTLAQVSPGTGIVLFQSDNDHHLAFALDQAGITPDLVLQSDFPGLTAALNNPDFGYALISNPCCFFDGGTPAALADFVDRGHVAQLTFWNMDAEVVLQGVFGISDAIDFFTPEGVYDTIEHLSWGDTPSPVLPEPGPSPWRESGEFITVSPAGLLIGTFGSITGPGAIAVSNEDRTLFNSFSYDSMDSSSIQSLLASQITWLVGPDTTCYADFDMDGSLTIFDFLAFQNAFSDGDLAADCDEDGILTLFDFLCFQNAFDAGCP